MSKSPPEPKNRPSDSPRHVALRILERFEKKHRPGHLKADRLIHEALEKQSRSKTTRQVWKDSDRRLLTALVYGVLRHWFLLEAVVGTLSRFPLNKIQPRVRALLRLGLFQMRFLDDVPDYAAIDTTVALARQLKVSSKTVRFINGLLREYQRRHEALPFPDPVDDPEGYLATEGALPRWFARRLLTQYPTEEVLAMAAMNNIPPPLTLRVNTLKITVEEYARRLSEAGIVFHPAEEVPEALVLEGFYGSPAKLPGFEEGQFYVQDVSSMLVSHWLEPQPGETIVDLCAAPGSKSTHLAALMHNRGQIFAIDPAPRRLTMFRQNLERLGVTMVTVSEEEAEDFRFPEGESADRVLVDAPCSGLGTARKHPEILLQVRESDLKTYPPLQKQLVKKGLSLLKPGGVLVYSTCSLEESENAAVIQTILQSHPHVALEAESQRLITFDSDGFYIARLRKRA